MYCAILAEYNPFHAGHLYQIQWVRENLNPAGLIIFMAGSFMQRGEPALWDKWARAANAIAAGADVVVEFPTASSILAAEDYALKAVEMMHDAGVTHQVFGVESASLEDLERWVKAQNNPVFTQHLQHYLGNGYSVAKARWLALVASGQESIECESIYRMPNHILGRQYIQAHLNLHTSIVPLPLPRMSGLPTAGELRQQLWRDDTSHDHQMMHPRHISQTLFSHLAYQYWRDSFRTPPHSEPGLDARIRHALAQSQNLEELLDHITTKHHSRARMRRYILQVILNYHAELYQLAKATHWPLRLLGVKRGRGEAVLRYWSEQATVPICTAYHTCEKLPPSLVDFEEKATDYHHYLLTEKLPSHIDRTHHFTLQP